MNAFNKDNEYYLIKMLSDRIDKTDRRIYKLERAILYGMGFAFIIGFSRFLLHVFFN